MTEAKKPAENPFSLPEGRLINHALFVKNAYKDDKGKEGIPKYSVELAFDPKQVQGEGTIEDIILDYLDRTVGGKAADKYLDGKMTGPFISGDELAERRAAKGKPGDAYAGKLVLRVGTQFNAEGDNAAGGVQVLGPDKSSISLELGNHSEVYQGCYGRAAVKMGQYLDAKGNVCLMMHLSAFQKTRDGDRLVTPSDHSDLFEPVGGGAAPAAGRRSRAG